jgi:hypothetical protein
LRDTGASIGKEASHDRRFAIGGEEAGRELSPDSSEAADHGGKPQIQRGVSPGSTGERQEIREDGRPPRKLAEESNDRPDEFRVHDARSAKYDVEALQVEDGLIHFRALDAHGEQAAEIELSQRADGRWEVGWMDVAAALRGGRLMNHLHDAIEREYGIRMQPSGWLLGGGYRFWKKRDPELVKYYQEVKQSWRSPRAIQEEIAKPSMRIVAFLVAGDLQFSAFNKHA